MAPKKRQTSESIPKLDLASRYCTGFRIRSLCRVSASDWADLRSSFGDKDIDKDGRLVHIEIRYKKGRHLTVCLVHFHRSKAAKDGEYRVTHELEYIPMGLESTAGATPLAVESRALKSRKLAMSIGRDHRSRVFATFSHQCSKFKTVIELPYRTNEIELEKSVEVTGLDFTIRSKSREYRQFVGVFEKTIGQTIGINSIDGWPNGIELERVYSEVCDYSAEFLRTVE